MMKIFDRSGILFIPKPVPTELCKAKKIIVVKDCFCPNGHCLISSRARFGDYNGIFLKVKTSNGEGYLALSPVFGDKSRISIDVDLPENELIEISCPKCSVELPVYGKCECGGELKVAFTLPNQDFNNCVGFCNRVGCRHAEIKNEGQMLSITSSIL
jgi:hypothetical protein